MEQPDLTILLRESMETFNDYFLSSLRLAQEISERGARGGIVTDTEKQFIMANLRFSSRFLTLTIDYLMNEKSTETH